MASCVIHSTSSAGCKTIVAFSFLTYSWMADLTLILVLAGSSVVFQNSHLNHPVWVHALPSTCLNCLFADNKAYGAPISLLFNFLYILFGIIYVFISPLSSSLLHSAAFKYKYFTISTSFPGRTSLHPGFAVSSPWLKDRYDWTFGGLNYHSWRTAF